MLDKSVNLPTKYGQFNLSLLDNPDSEHFPHIVLYRGELGSDSTPLIRIHSECATGDIFGSLRCECGPQLEKTLEILSKEQDSILFYLRQEGRGIGLLNKMKAYLLQEEGLNTVEANLALGLQDDAREYSAVTNYLVNRGIGAVKLLTNNPEKSSFLEKAGLTVQRLPLVIPAQEHSADYLKTKREYFKHYLP